MFNPDSLDRVGPRSVLSTLRHGYFLKFPIYLFSSCSCTSVSNQASICRKFPQFDERIFARAKDIFSITRKFNRADFMTVMCSNVGRNTVTADSVPNFDGSVYRCRYLKIRKYAIHVNNLK